jgi:hypothetical protein
VPLGNSKVKALGITANSNSFASDFIYVDGQGREYHDDPRILENWYGYGKPIYGFLDALTGLGQHCLHLIVGGRFAQGRRPSERGMPLPK